jgi:hypothetical protein
MIKEEKIDVKIVGRTLKTYKELGYDCNVGDIISIKIQDISKNSHVKITAICDLCGHEKTLSMYAYNKNYEKYEYYSCNNCKQTKIEKTNNKLYGVNRPIQNIEIQKKQQKTNLETYGVTIASKNKDVISKIVNTHIERFGDISSRTEEIKEKSRKSIETNLMNKYSPLNIESINENLCTFNCTKGHKYEISFSNLHNRIKYGVNLCTICNPINNSSDKEYQLLYFIQNNYHGTIIIKDRNILDGKELDIYLPDLKLAFEFNGLYWHSEIYKEENYHYNKTKVCREKNIQLLHIYEDEWDNKNDIIKSMILNKLGKCQKRIFARKTEIKEINDIKLVKWFLNNNHIQGFVGSSVKLGLFYNNELVSLMTFKNTKGIYELNRFCNMTNSVVIGGFSKLLKYFQNNFIYSKIISFAKLDYSYGDVYEKYFVLEKQLKPDYSYIINGVRKHKFNFRMKSEKEKMFEKGYYKIYNCGLLKYSIEI